jgi:hypothetical protein
MATFFLTNMNYYLNYEVCCQNKMNIIPILVQFVGHDEDNGGVLDDGGKLMEGRK